MQRLLRLCAPRRVAKLEVDEALAIFIDKRVRDLAELLALTLHVFGDVQPPLGIGLLLGVEQVLQQQAGRGNRRPGTENALGDGLRGERQRLARCVHGFDGVHSRGKTGRRIDREAFLDLLVLASQTSHESRSTATIHLQTAAAFVEFSERLHGSRHGAGSRLSALTRDRHANRNTDEF